MKFTRKIQITQDVELEGEAFQADDGTVLLPIENGEKKEKKYITARRKSPGFCPVVGIYPFIPSRFKDSSRDPLPISKDEAMDIIWGALDDITQIVEAMQ